MSMQVKTEPSGTGLAPVEPQTGDGDGDGNEVNTPEDSNSYAQIQRTWLHDSQGSHYPERMITQLDTRRLAHLQESSALVKQPNAVTCTRPNTAYAIIMREEGLDFKNRELHAISLDLDRANQRAMLRFWIDHSEYMVNPGFDPRRTADPLNFKGSPFKEAERKHANWIRSFEAFYEAAGTMDCSAWGIDERGCLGLLAVKGMRYFYSVYVEEKMLV
ncbi:hypothetical protein F4818DRAFT_70714 [Hypoxylon cercidicola]|nr:hypothetical protein F4818DRAFT_70714 [Hypoxylon cercidicola]